MSPASYRAKPILNARDAIASHIRWKISLLLATRRREPLSARANHSIHHPEYCHIRKWLLSKLTLPLRAAPELRAALDLHTAFHSQMQIVAGLIDIGDFEEADRLLNSPGPFQDASNALANALMALDACANSRPAH